MSKLPFRSAGSTFELPLVISDSDEEPIVRSRIPRKHLIAKGRNGNIGSSTKSQVSGFGGRLLAKETDSESSEEDIRGPINRKSQLLSNQNPPAKNSAAEKHISSSYPSRDSRSRAPRPTSFPTQTAKSPNTIKRQRSPGHSESPSKRYQFSNQPTEIGIQFDTERGAKIVAPSNRPAHILAHTYIELSDDDYDGDTGDIGDGDVESREGASHLGDSQAAADNYYIGFSDTEVEDENEGVPPLSALELKQRSIKNLAGAMFNRTLETAEAQGLNGDDRRAVVDITSDVATIRKIVWNSVSTTNEVMLSDNKIWYEPATGHTGYPFVEIDNLKYCLGDFCIVRPPEGTEASEKGDPWFALIVSIFIDEDDEPSCHLQWLEHGSSTILGETAGPYELFLLDQCDDNPITCIAGKIQVHFVRDEHQDLTAEVMETLYNDNRYFCRFVYNKEKEMFTHTPSRHIPVPTNFIQGKDCYCCLKTKKEIQFNLRTITGDISNYGDISGYQHLGVSYRVHDFVYITPQEESQYAIGQIVAFKILNYHTYSASPMLLRENAKIVVTVKLLERYHDRDKIWWKIVTRDLPRNIRDNRRLYLTNSEIQMPAEFIEGRCQVRHVDDISDLDSYKDQNNTFWIKDRICKLLGQSNFEPLLKSELLDCKESKTETATRESMLNKFIASTQPLSALELCAGCGGLCLGLDRSGAVKTKWAVEFAPAAARTLKANLPGVQVYNEDGSKCLQRAIKESRGLTTTGERDISGNFVSPMPKRGEVDMICGGFPCPGYTRANQRPLADDVKNTLITMVLSYVDFYRPKYVLLENVRGILTHRLGAKQCGDHKVKGGVERGTLKFILRALTSLGYACQFTTLQTGEFSVPQNRQRVFFWAALRGNDLPNYPQPTSTWSGSCPVSWHRIGTPGVAPHREVTVGDAITDLPTFDWENPHNIIPETHGEHQDRYERSKTINQFPVLRGKEYVGIDKQAYAFPPLTEYQRVLRKGVPAVLLRNHVTQTFFDKPPMTGRLKQAVTEQVCNIEMIPGADHLGLPRKLKLWCLSHRDSAAERHNYYPGRYGRLSYNGPFQTCMTKVCPNGKNGNVVHPTQHRIITIREQARAMGFPDSFVWDLTNTPVKLAFRMIGNAVPVILATKIGEELLEARFQTWIRNKVQDGDNIKKGDKNSIRDDSIVVSSPGSDLDSEAATLAADEPEGWHVVDSD